MIKINPEDYNIIDSGYADNKEDFNLLKQKWKIKNPYAKVRRVRTDTKGLIMYDVIEVIK